VLSCDLSLITMHISDCCQFSGIHISQGSVATYLRCGGIFKYEFVANLPMSLPVKEFWKSVNIWGSYGQEFSVLFFLRHSVQLEWQQLWRQTQPSAVWFEPRSSHTAVGRANHSATAIRKSMHVNAPSDAGLRFGSKYNEDVCPA